MVKGPIQTMRVFKAHSGGQKRAVESWTFRLVRRAGQLLFERTP